MSDFPYIFYSKGPGAYLRAFNKSKCVLILDLSNHTVDEVSVTVISRIRYFVEKRKMLYIIADLQNQLFPFFAIDSYDSVKCLAADISH